MFWGLIPQNRKQKWNSWLFTFILQVIFKKQHCHHLLVNGTTQCINLRTVGMWQLLFGTTEPWPHTHPCQMWMDITMECVSVYPILLLLMPRILSSSSFSPKCLRISANARILRVLYLEYSLISMLLWTHENTSSFSFCLLFPHSASSYTHITVEL